MCYTTWFSFFVVSFLTALSPGPGSIQAMNYGFSHGFKKTILVIIGQEIALSIILTIIGFGAGFILSSNNIIFIIKIFGAFWLIYTGYLTWNSPIKINKNNDLIKKKYSLSKIKLFISGFMTTITNAKIIIFMSSLIPQFIVVKNCLFKQLLIMILTMVFTDTFMMNIYAFCASKIKHLIYKPKIKKIQNRFFGMALILSGISIFFPFS